MSSQLGGRQVGHHPLGILHTLSAAMVPLGKWPGLEEGCRERALSTPARSRPGGRDPESPRSVRISNQMLRLPAFHFAKMGHKKKEKEATITIPYRHHFIKEKDNLTVGRTPLRMKFNPLDLSKVSPP